MQKFHTTIEIIIGNPYVSVPEAILEIIFETAKKHTGPIPVRGKLNGSPFKQTLVKYTGAWRLYLNGSMLKQAGITFKTGEIRSVVGREVNVEIEFDPVSRELPMHPKLKIALANDLQAKKAFEQLAPYRKHEILRYLDFLKTEASVERNVLRVLQHLRGERTDALYPLMRRGKEETTA